MEQFLYEDLYKQEDKHWWHLAKRAAVVGLIERLLRTSRIRSARNDKRGRSKILDLGCGTGKNMEVLSQFGETYGVDLSKEAVEFCKKRGLTSVRVGSSYKTGYDTGNFNLVTLLDVLEHTDDDKTLVEINRILGKNGILIINVPAFQWLWSQWDEVLHHRRRYTKKSLEKVINRNGFKVIEISYMFSYLVIPAVIVRTIKSRFSKNDYSSDFNYSNGLINKIMFWVSATERKIMKYIPMPIGTSLICAAKKVK